MTATARARLAQIVEELWSRQELLGARNRELVAEARTLVPEVDQPEPAPTDNSWLVTVAIRPTPEPGRRWAGWWHLHHDPNYTVDAVHRYDECRCGARRTTWIAVNLIGPTRADWPPLVDRHGFYRQSSGWQPEPAGGWPPPPPKPAPPTCESGVSRSPDGRR